MSNNKTNYMDKEAAARIQSHAVSLAPVTQSILVADGRRIAPTQTRISNSVLRAPQIAANTPRLLVHTTMPQEPARKSNACMRFVSQIHVVYTVYVCS